MPEAVDDAAFQGSDELLQLVGQNTGNLAFHYGVNRIIGAKPANVPWYATADQINAAGELAIMPCANQLGTHVDMGSFAAKLEIATPRIVAVGLGAQGSSLYSDLSDLPEGTVAWLKQLVSHAPEPGKPNITVRGDFTMRVLEKYGFSSNAVSLGCPSLLINPNQDLGRQLQDKYDARFDRVAVAAGHPAWAPLSGIESALVRIMMDTDGAYIIQATGEALALARSDKTKDLTPYKKSLRAYLGLNLSDEQFDRWVRRYMVAFYNIPAWMEYIRGFDFVVGSRIHGIMLAMQAGVPGLCIAHDSRIRELCEKSRIPCVLASNIKGRLTIEDLRSMVEFDGHDFDANRSQIRGQYLQFFQDNGVNVSGTAI